ncbi:MAG: hypothetical protein JF600_12910 [Xanthomonadales bacterium]|nr:hypothetical protein [Xanthomonadales bacterium]
MNKFLSALLATTLLASCGSPTTGNEPQNSSQSPGSKSFNPDLLSADGELFPLSTFFGVCARHVGVLRSTFDNGMLSPHYPTYAVLTGDGGELKITVGKFGMMPNTELQEVPATSFPRRIRVGRDRLQSFILVSDFENSGNNLVSIAYDGTDQDAKTAALRLANNIVACHVSTAPLNARHVRKSP